MTAFYLSIGLGMVRWSPNLLYAHKQTKFSDDVAFEVGSLGNSGAWPVLWRSRCIPCHRNLATVFAAWSGVMYVIMCFVKWLQKMNRFTTLGGWSDSIVVSMLVHSTCSNSKGVVTMKGAWGLWHDCPCIHLSMPTRWDVEQAFFTPPFIGASLDWSRQCTP